MKHKLHYCRRELVNELNAPAIPAKDDHLFEGSRAEVVRWLKANNLWREYKQHKIRIGYYL